MAATTLISFAEFERLNDSASGLELLKGVAIQVPPPQNYHMDVCERLYELLKAAVERLHGADPALPLGRVHIERGYRFPGEPSSWLRPDVSVTHPEQPSDRYYLGAPLLAFEVVSESDSASALDEKISEYLAHGAAEVWLIYPAKRHAWIYDRSATARQEMLAIHTPLLPGVEIPLNAIL